MAEHSFQEVMRQFDRMCRHYQRKLECPMGCPMNGVNISQCRKIAFEEPVVTEQTVMQWAEENQEPVYPTFREWLTTFYFQTRKPVDGGHEGFDTWMNRTRIPDEIAKKLGLKPKEG